jgi:hypothetical protein
LISLFKSGIDLTEFGIVKEKYKKREILPIGGSLGIEFGYAKNECK